MHLLVGSDDARNRCSAYCLLSHKVSIPDGSGSSTDSLPSIGVLISSAHLIVANSTMLSLQHTAQHSPERLQLKLAESGVIHPLGITLNRTSADANKPSTFVIPRHQLTIFLRLFELPPNTFENDEATGLVVRRLADSISKDSANNHTTPDIVHYGERARDHADPAARRDDDGRTSGTEDWEDASIDGTDSILPDRRACVFTTCLMQRLVEVDVTSGQPHAMWIVEK
ncbi:hypothetical protein BLNAU_5111 [Blattamonas nauphoetae]|uniref:Uncharacterized protein n=1 Tax=Blattamonas nauphoetae TaxID=2049346 RepID=A0ABQ9Y8B8_9EUKA|nr:hypothetical protein BLNAU_5111 [Blattamonas nauphoetae]